MNPLDKTNVVFLVRDGFFSDFGGDTFQIKMYCNSLDKCNSLSTKIIEYSEVRNGDIQCLINAHLIFIVNLDRFFELIEFKKIIDNLNLCYKLHLISIHHEIRAIDRFNRKRHLPLNFFYVEKMKNVFRGLRSLSNMFLSLKHLFMSYEVEVRNILNDVNGIVLIASGEGDVIQKDFKLDIYDKCKVIRNGVPSYYLNIPVCSWSKKEWDVIVCGRIECRKNQLAIAKQLANTGVRVLFVGGYNKRNIKYYKQFLKLVNDNDNLHYIGKVAPEELPNLYALSKVSYSASWFEVSSLVDLEAFASGCFVFSSKYGHSNESIPNEYFYTVEPSDIFSSMQPLLQKIDYLKINEEREVSPREIRTWDDAGSELLEYIKAYV
ncbi:glycosyltransferase [Vibrio mangrovi]|uniref:Glycosyl transferases group 1 n=1 Tax=Vibrio mangrovi TaxID=474394 RepID=A0A1Y6IV12_9VIBR|nr:glycosyltransferase [Vibrio mangrovi]MDW6002160.1 glycosyltransferase [Vibrio mangrovi]SMS01505.1 Glycosyl transferases group 1 [Vibrio mangrovi]